MKKIFTSLLLLVISSCIDPYIPNLNNYKQLLVVEGLISNENSSYLVKLGKTFSQRNGVPEMVTDAKVFVMDGNGRITELQNCGNGYYKTDSTTFTGVIGQNYSLKIITDDGKEYKSDACTMLPVPDIEKIYFDKGEEISGSPEKMYTGLRILLNTTPISEMPIFLRWTFEEVWKTIIPGVQRYTFKKIADTIFTFREVIDKKDICWKRSQSGEIVISSITSDRENFITNQEVQFINPVISDKLTHEYSILVKQYSISSDEYEFWKNIKKAGNSGGDIFASQPYTVISNIHNVNNPGEMVLGYFEVSAISHKRIFISSGDLDRFYLPQNVPDCKLIAKCPDDYPDPKPSWTQMYNWFVNRGFIFVEPLVKEGTVLDGSVYQSKLLKFVFSTKSCSICEPPGSTSKPDFWIF